MQVIFLIFFSMIFKTVIFAESTSPTLIFFKEGPCEAQEEIVRSEEFSEKIPETVSIEILDCEELTIDERKKLKDQYHIQEFPRLVLLDQKGCEIMRLGLRGEKPKTLADRILSALKQVHDLEIASQNLREIDPSSSDLESFYKNALSLKREKEALAFLEWGCEKNQLFFLLEKYRIQCENGFPENEIKEKILSIDSRNEGGSLLTLALIDFQYLVSRGSSKEAILPLENYLQKYGDRDLKNRWRIEMMIAQFYLNYDEYSISLQHAMSALKEAPSDVQQEITKCCGYIKECIERPLASSRE